MVHVACNKSITAVGLTYPAGTLQPLCGRKGYVVKGCACCRLGQDLSGGTVDSDRKKQRKQKAFDPYSSFEANEIKGGKHGTAMHKMGNRSMTFS